MTKTVIEYVLSRLQDLGVNDIFGVAGDCLPRQRCRDQ